ncbi:MAG: gliding motility-associated C-terminal domain-containing protein, partial [Bacteroidota bacterium]
ATSTTVYPLTDFEWASSVPIIGAVDAPAVTVASEANAVFTLSVSNAFGCSLDTFYNLPAPFVTPQVTVTPSLDTIQAGESITLQATDDDNYLYSWSPPAGLSGTAIPNPSASPDSATVYTVTVLDENGCQATATATVVLFDTPCRDPYIFVPNAFSPNGDQLNDRLEVQGNLIEEFYLAIYDRWGERVFESFDQADSWDGTFKGRELTPDVYGYHLEVRCIGGTLFQDRGNVTLLR